MNYRRMIAGLLITGIVTAVCGFTSVDDGPISKIAALLDQWVTAHPQEKVYLHLDKPYYAAGDNIWFKAYVTVGSKHQLSAISRVLNVELIDDRDSVKQSITLPVAAGLTWGDFALPDTLAAGNYRIRAYTNWMRNAGEAYFFDKPISIVSVINRINPNLKLAGRQSAKKPLLIKAISAKVDVQFFPEGGNLVIGNVSKIAFKAVGADGLGAEIKGIVVDGENNRVANFSSSHLGMGEFEFNPENGKTYKARVVYTDGSEGDIALPKATNDGYSLIVDNTAEDKITVKVIPGAVITAAQQTGVMALVGEAGGTIYYAGQSKPGSKFFTAEIPKSKFPSGIVRFTLFSATGEPMNERLVFVQNPDQLKLNVSADKQTYAPRDKVKIDLNADEASGKPVIGSFSVSVTDETKVPVDEAGENSILSNLLLTSDIKGYIEKPNYYFANASQQTAADLDVLMLTQGYHRFEWKEVLNDAASPNAYEAEKGLQITGHIKTLGGKPVPNGKVILFSSAGGSFLVDTVADKDGKFTFTNLVFRDSVRFVVQARTAKDRKNLQIDLDNTTPQIVGINKNAPDMHANIDSGFAPFLKNSKLWYEDQLKFGIGNHTVQLQEVKIKAQKAPLVENSSNLNGPGNANQVVKATDIERLGCARLTDCLRGIMAGVVFRNDTPYSTRSLNKPMLVIINGVEVGIDVLNNLTASDIESIEVLRSIEYTSIYGGKGSEGILIFTTKKGGYNNGYQHYAPGIITYMPKGYYKTRIFYSPQYDNPKTNPDIPDLRSTIYWNPNIITTKEGKASFGFFGADSKGIYRVVIEGIDNNGNLGRQVYRISVGK